MSFILLEQHRTEHSFQIISAVSWISDAASCLWCTLYVLLLLASLCTVTMCMYFAHSGSHLSQVCFHFGHLHEYIENKLEHYSWFFFLTFPFHLVSKDSVKHEYSKEVDMKYAVQHTLKPKGQSFYSAEDTGSGISVSCFFFHTGSKKIPVRRTWCNSVFHCNILAHCP